MNMLRLLVSGFVFSACASVHATDSSEGTEVGEEARSKACAAGTGRVHDLLSDATVAQCARNEDCVNLSPFITGRCNVFVSERGFAANRDVFRTRELACDALPQLSPSCEAQVGSCEAGQCVGRTPVVAEADCSLAELILTTFLSRPAHCEADTDCIGVTVGRHDYVALAKSPERLAATAQWETQCGHPTLLRSARDAPFATYPAATACVHQVCTSVEVVKSRPSVDPDCFKQAVLPLATGVTERMMIIKADISAQGVANHFLFMRPVMSEESKATLARALHACAWKPALYNGKPIGLSDVLLNFDLRAATSPDPLPGR